MYSTCLFCNQRLGANEAIEHFPVGRRLAFDEAKGRLLVVCRKCERWNLTPLEERWEAIEECEKAFRATRMRVSTDHIGLARLKEGLELVRIGEPQRPEMAAWRYGDQFGRRRRRRLGLIAGATVIGGTVLVAGPLLGLVMGGLGGLPFQLVYASRGIYRYRTLVHIPTPNGTIATRLTEVPKARLSAEGDGLVLTVPVVSTRAGPWWRYQSDTRELKLTGMDAIRAAGAILPRLNVGGGSRAEVGRAVEYLEATSDPLQLFRRAADTIKKFSRDPFIKTSKTGTLQKLPTAGRLALEMAAHEDTERRALEGELHILEEAWKQAEEIAGIAYDMFLPESVEKDLARLRSERDNKPEG